MQHKHSFRAVTGSDTTQAHAQDSVDKIFENAFLQNRQVFLWGEVNSQSAREITNRLLYFEKQQKGAPITFYIHSAGGSVSSGMLIYDVMQMISSPVSTVVLGMAASMAAILLAGGHKGKRFCLPHAEMMIHQPALDGIFQGTFADIHIQAEQIRKAKQIGANTLAKHAGQTVQKVLEDFERDYWLNADEAIEYGIVDGVLETL